MAALVALALGGAAVAQIGSGYRDAGETRTALAEARAQARAAGARAARLEVEARSTRAAAQRTAREAAAVAARIQQAESEIAAARARIALARSARAGIERRLAERREPLARLTGGLQKLARRPLALAVLRPGSLRETVYLRAMLDATLPEVRRRTAALRGELDRAQAIEAEARAAYAAFRDGERVLAERRTRLAALETRQRLASREAGGAAAREAERALALAEEARDLDALVTRLDAAGTLRARLAALPGPLLRPPRPGASEVLVDGPAAASPREVTRPRFVLPVNGRTVAGFGQPGVGGALSDGIALAPAAGAQVVAPAAGRVAFAGPFRGFDRIVIVEHAGGFTSLVTGLARVDVTVGEELVAGAPVGVAGGGRPIVGFELRREGEPVNPVDYLR
ncbi:murein hydrolase activator EnvC family protein [Tsuneonella sp. SYSU-LHT278]